MALNTPKFPESGLPMPTDVVDGDHYQYLKLADGTAGSSAKIPGDATYGLDVDITRMPAAATLSMLVPNGTQADQRLTVDATAGGVQFAAFHADTTQVYWSCEDAQCRVTFDNSAPTATNGHIINPGDSGVWAKALATAAKLLRTGASSATIHASQMK